MQPPSHSSHLLPGLQADFLSIFSQIVTMAPFQRRYSKHIGLILSGVFRSPRILFFSFLTTSWQRFCFFLPLRLDMKFDCTPSFEKWTVVIALG